MADLIRWIAVLSGGVCIGFAVISAIHYAYRYVVAESGHPAGPLSPRRLLGILLVRFAIVGGSVVVAKVMLDRIASGARLSWIAPLIIVNEIACAFGIVLVHLDDQAQLDAAAKGNRRATDALAGH